MSYKQEPKNEPKTPIEINGLSYISLEGWFELSNANDYEQFRFSLGAAREPEVYFGPPSTHGLYRVLVYADNRLAYQTDWLDYTAIQSCTVDIAGSSTVRIVLDQTYGSNYNGNDIIYTLNIVLYDAQFMK